MSFEWLRMRIQEEADRRKREASTLGRLPVALEELHGLISECLADYTEAFGKEAADLQLLPERIKITVRELQNSKWQTVSRVEVSTVPELPGFRIERAEYSLAIEVGLLPNNKLFYRDCEQDKYLTMDELTKRILDRALFPKLKE